MSRPRWARAPPRRLRDDEQGAFQVLEALLAAIIVAGAVVFYGNLTEENDTPLVERNVTERTVNALESMQGESPGDLDSDMLRQLVVEGFLLNKTANFTAAKAVLEDLLPDGASYTLGLNNGYGTLSVIDESGGSSSGDASVSTAYLVIGTTDPEWNLTLISGATTVVVGYAPPNSVNFDMNNRAICSPPAQTEAYQQAGDGRTWDSIFGSNSDTVPLAMPFGLWSFGANNAGGQGQGQGNNNNNNNLDCNKFLYVVPPGGVMPNNHLYTVELVVW